MTNPDNPERTFACFYQISPLKLREDIKKSVEAGTLTCNSEDACYQRMVAAITYSLAGGHSLDCVGPENKACPAPQFSMAIGRKIK